MALTTFQRTHRTRDVRAICVLCNLPLATLSQRVFELLLIGENFLSGQLIDAYFKLLCNTKAPLSLLSHGYACASHQVKARA